MCRTVQLRWGAIAVATAFWLATTACDTGREGASSRALPRAVQELPLPALLQGVVPVGWISVYDPERASNGYTLGFYRHRWPILFDMNGRIVHSWPEVRMRSRVRLLPDGSLLGLSTHNAVVEYDWDGNLVWEYKIEGGFAHHDVERLESGNTLFPVLLKGERSDDLFEVDREGRRVWHWRAADHLVERSDGKRRGESRNFTHINSVRPLPENRWFDDGDERFRPGNILISARNLSAIYVLDRETGEPVWSFMGELDFQHEAVMKRKGTPGAGNIVVFNNGYRGAYKYRKSSMIEIDPSDLAIVWEYESETFYSPTMGLGQPLRNGNVLVTSSRGGRSFEITPSGTVVWEWTPPYEPTRPARYPYDHTPQLRALARGDEIAVVPAAGYRFVDRDVYRFSRRGARRDRQLDGVKRNVLRDNNACSALVLPAAATVDVGYGIDAGRVAAVGSEDQVFRFGLRLEVSDTGEEIPLMAQEVAGNDGRWHEASFDLAPWEYRKVELCVETVALGSAAGQATGDLAFWASPAIASRAVVATAAEGDAELEGLTPEEVEVRRDHLKAMGYVN